MERQTNLPPDSWRRENKRPLVILRRAFRAFALIGLFVLAATYTASAQEPRQVIQHFQDVLLETMKRASELGASGRYNRLRPEVEKAFDLPRMIRLASGTAWSDASPDRQKALVDAFTHMSTSTYASQFRGYSGESFVISGVREGPRNTQLVETKIVKSDGEKVPITYVLVTADNGEWRIGDVLLDNSISELSVRRSEYAAILRKSGVDALIKTLNEKAEGLMSSK